MSKKLGLVLGSGGSRGFAHIGFLQAMKECGITADVMSGCSIGAVIGGAFLCGKSPEELKKIAFSLKQNDLVDFNIGLFKGMSLLRSVKMETMLKKCLTKETFDELPIPFAVVATDLVSGNLITFSSGELLPAVRASASIPTVFAPVRLYGRVLVDGGLLCRTPVAAAKDLGADVVVAVDLLGKLPDYSEPENIIQLATRAIDVADHRPSKPTRKDTPDLMLLPELKGVNQYVIEDQQFCYDAGYKLGVERAEDIKKLLR